jgi:DNA polymerase III subunit alpha
VAIKTSDSAKTSRDKTSFDSSQFVHLHNHSHYSVLDGLQKVPEMLERVKELGMEAVALTDHGTLSGVIELYQKAEDYGIKPIIGMETYIAPRAHTDKEGKADSNPFHLILLAQNNQGYENLMKLSSIAYLEGFYYKPRIDRQLLEKHNQGLIVLSGCINSEVGDAVRNNQIAQAESTIDWYKKVFGDRYYLEVQDHGHMWAEQDKVNKQLLKLGKQKNVPVVVTADAHYCVKADQDAHEVLLCVQTGSLVEDEKRMSLKDMDLYVSDPVDIAKRWEANPEVLTNTRIIADRCQVEIEFGKILIPTFPTPSGQNEYDYLEELTYQGMAWRYAGKSREAASKLTAAEVSELIDEDKIKRLKTELAAIQKMRLSGYFLIVSDLINWSKNQGIIIGPGRGSAAGSIVSYVLNITTLDPLEYDLLFERFLNPDRISMPDIDMDFQDDRRDEVIDYVTKKYGKDRVANIVTFGKMAARNAIRDTARVLNVPYAEADRLAKMVPPPVQGRHTSLSKHLEQIKELKFEYQNNQQARRVFDLAMRLEGTIRSHGVHAAGVVIAPDEITKFTPLEMAQKGVVATQYSMWPIEDLGLLKMDFLGLSNLTTIKNALRIIRKVNDLEIDISAIPLDDKATFKLLAKGDTTGVFQLESAGMKRYIKKLQPNRLDDIIAMVALYRPGPMQWIEDFIDRKHGKKKIEYLHPTMQAALENTYGVIVYQEQVMQISKDMCGFTGGQADTLRKAIGKKIPEMLAKQKDAFIEGAIRTSNVEKQLVERLWTSLEDFAAYAFPKAHAACYAMIAYYTAYLKANYPAAFMAALMTSDFEDNERIAIEVSECRAMGIEVLPPDVNESYVEFAVVPDTNAIRFGMSAIKNVGVGAVEAILEARQEGGNFSSVEDFAKRVPVSQVNRKTWESLIKAGAFDKFADRGTLLHNLDVILAYAGKLQKEGASGQVDLFGASAQDLSPSLHLQTPPEELNERVSLQWERQLLGLYLTEHPLHEYQAYLEAHTQSLAEITTDMEGQTIKAAGFISAVRKITTRNGANMAFVRIEDLTGEVELIVFPKAFEATPELWEVDKVVLAKGKVSSKDRDGNVGSEVKIMVDKASELDHDKAKKYQPRAPSEQAPAAVDKVVEEGPLVIELPSEHGMGELAKMKQLLSKYQGNSEVLLVLGEGTKIRLPFTVGITAQLRQDLAKLFAQETISIS